ncbi:MAG: sodium:glutamate symporter [Ruminococcaceae bacterium]|nr:sodium:glutamate symporter [Oscillospiraceae bacterium]
MDFSQANTSLWNPIIQIGIIAGLILVANILRRKLAFIRNSLIPTAVLAGFILLGLKYAFPTLVDPIFLEKLTYHALAFGFIAMSLRIPEKQNESTPGIAAKSGALIVSTYLMQAITGLVVSLVLAYTMMPDLFKASGILLPMAYGQGPGQANNVGSTYEALGMAGGRSFGLSLSAAGYLCACVVGVIFLNIYARKGKLRRIKDKEYLSGSVTVDTFQDHNEIPISESIDKFSMQIALVCFIYLFTFLLIWGVSALLGLISEGLAGTVSTLLWGFNFIIGSALAIAVRSIMKNLRRFKVMNQQYQNNYLLSRISGLAFDLMIVSGIASINFEDLSGYWLPFGIMAILGGIVTFAYLKWVCNKIYKGYENEGFFSMYGMLTGTISSGVLLLREIDPEMKTPASDNLVYGSSFGIVFGAPMLLIISFAAKGEYTAIVSIGIIIVYLAALLAIIFAKRKNKKG